MKLKAYLDEYGITRREFGAKIGRDAAQVSRWANGSAVPRLQIAHRIREVTDGMVTPEDFLPPAPVSELQDRVA